MGIWDTITDLVDAATPWSTVEAEAPSSNPAGAGPASESASEVATETVDDSKSTEESSDESESKEEDTEDEPEEEEEEEEEEELKDPKETLEEECRNSKQCAPAKHHFEECVERVENGSKEDCVEEFFHLTHCATQCAAPKLWSILK
ncbi:Non-heme 11 kDa protein of cytochrome bc1 complex [Coniochaeta ligniaria NRRL 30616]|uniref:Cytochrome b-c1 complex subunit 6, mitochondrial n=1 Tax=Coniochaeta ligniaria NRRL 30616 TaxID=1408157 RepID=A0A1J7IUT6_9PEZI|nr:Non-heme 11 kDa protein of cytochrome bc1 complex [Coniochaeta ligniaria NRRL 30616]